MAVVILANKKFFFPKITIATKPWTIGTGGGHRVQPPTITVDRFYNCYEYCEK